MRNQSILVILGKHQTNMALHFAIFNKVWGSEVVDLYCNSFFLFFRAEDVGDLTVSERGLDYHRSRLLSTCWVTDWNSRLSRAEATGNLRGLRCVCTRTCTCVPPSECVFCFMSGARRHGLGVTSAVPSTHNCPTPPPGKKGVTKTLLVS